MSTNRTCGECKYYIPQGRMCNLRIALRNIRPSDRDCGCFRKKTITNGEKLWTSGYDAVITFCKTWMEKFSCWAEAEDWLNAPADAPDTDVGTKESDGKDE